MSETVPCRRSGRGRAAALGRSSGRVITNTTRSSKPAIIDQLAGCGVAIAPEELTTPAGAAVDWLRAWGRSADLLIAPARMPIEA